jgi:spoIIIJ-associated protein
VQSVVGSGPTLEEAVQDALARLGASPDQVVLRKVEEGSAGLMGNAVRPYRVRATWRPEFAPPPPPPEPVKPPEPPAFHGEEVYAPAARPSYERGDRGGRGGRERGDRGGGGGGGGGRFERGGRGGGGSRGGRDRDRDTFIDPEHGRAERLSRPARKSAPPAGEDRFVVDEAFLARVREEARAIVDGLGMEAEVEVTGSGDEVLVALESTVDDAILTGRRGETRMAIQAVLSRLVNPRRGAAAHVMVDVNGYWQKRRDGLLEQARDLAAQAVSSGEEMVTGPLAAEERRLVHRVLADDPRVATESFGDGALKRISIRALEGVGPGAAAADGAGPGDEDEDAGD